MDVSEFKAWFEGFTEGFSGTPTKKQWERIKEKIVAIDGNRIVYREYYDRYYKPWHTYTLPCNAVPLNAGSFNAAAENSIGQWVMNSTDTVSFNSETAMYALGRAEADEFK